MRAAAIVLAALLLAVPTTGAIHRAGPAAPPDADGAALDPRLVPLLPADLRDGDLLRLLAPAAGLHPTPRAPPPAPAPGDTVPAAALRLARLAGAHDAAPDHFAQYASLDPRLAAPVLAQLVAIEHAWLLRDHAVTLTSDELRELRDLAERGDAATPRAQQLAAGVDMQALLDAAILLLDTLDAVVLPALQDLADSDAWPQEALRDDVGVLRVGGTGDDEESKDRILQIDPRGHDRWLNNAGATTLLDDLDPTTPDFNVAVHVDLEGDDVYDHAETCQGGAFAGVGIALDLEGIDSYRCARLGMGGGQRGIGYLRDRGGNDTYGAGSYGIGGAVVGGFGIVRDDAGDDVHSVGATSGGAASADGSLGLLWDRGGSDTYASGFNTFTQAYGFGIDGGRGWLVDEGPSVDSYFPGAIVAVHTCNDCTWAAGYGAGGWGTLTKLHGRGNDNMGGLAYLVAHQELGS